jgi:hypothetical protein
MSLLDKVPRLNLHKGHRRIKALLGDAAYGTPNNMKGTKARKVIPLLSKPGQPHGSGLGKWRWVVERTLTWFCNRRRLRCCYEKTPEHFQAFNDLAAADIVARKLDALEKRF